MHVYKSSPNITDEFPFMVHGGGISSIMVFAGNWLLYEYVGFRGEIPVPDTDGSDYIFKKDTVISCHIVQEMAKFYQSNE